MDPKKQNIILIASVVVMLLIASPAGAALESLIKKLEEGGEAALNAYDDGYGNWTIGFGSIYNYDLNRPVRKGDKITEDQAYRYMRYEIESVVSAIKKMVKVPITEKMLYALASLGYNIGTGALAGSTLIRKLNAGVNKQEVSGHFLDFVKATNKTTGRLEFSQGLYNRRVLEKNLFNS